MCYLQLNGPSTGSGGLPLEQISACMTEASSVVAQLTVCAGAGLGFDKQVVAVDAAGDGVLNAEILVSQTISSAIERLAKHFLHPFSARSSSPFGQSQKL